MESKICKGVLRAYEVVRQGRRQESGSGRQAAECKSNGRGVSSMWEGVRSVMCEWKENIIGMGSGQSERKRGWQENAMCIGGGQGGREREGGSRV